MVVVEGLTEMVEVDSGKEEVVRLILDFQPRHHLQHM